MNVAVDLGGTFLRCGTFDGNALFDVTRRNIRNVFDGIPANAVWSDILRHISDYAVQVRKAHGPVERIVVGFPGPVLHNSVAVCAPTITGSADPFDFSERLRELAGCDVVLLNDVSAAAWHLAARLPYPRFMVVTVSSGIGSKLVLRTPQVVVIDDCTFAGEIGHVVVDSSDDAVSCDCGGRGHLGAIASGRGYERAARIAAQRNPAAFATSIAASRGVPPEALTNEADLVPALLANDRWSWSILLPQIDALARVLAPVIHAAGLRNVVLIGGFATSIGNAYAFELEKAAQRYCAGGLFGMTSGGVFEVLPLDEDACLHGAALYGQRYAAAVQ